MFVLIASSSAFRRRLYQDVLQDLGHRVSVAPGGVDCLEQVRANNPDLLLLESSLLWGGSEGVLEILQGRNYAQQVRTLLIAAGSSSLDWFRLSRFRVEDCLFRVPTAQELQRIIGSGAPVAASGELVTRGSKPDERRAVQPSGSSTSGRYP
jgi:DNA-binding response OmpR family regulator